MKISQQKIIPSDRIKCIHRYNNYIVCGLYTGTLLFIADNMIKKQVKICSSAIRALASTTNLLAGTDDGEIVVLDPSLRRVKSIKVHYDFVRKVRTSKEYIFTCSDDFLIKKIKDDDITVLKGHEHFVMDIQVVDDERLLSCSLDTTLKLWNYKTDVLLMTFKGHTKGINSISVFKNTFYSVGDDFCLRIWNNNACRIKESISSRNIDHVKVTDDLIVTGAEDGYYKIFKRQGEQLEHSVYVGSCIWDSLVEDDAFFVASDSGLLIYGREDAKINRYVVDRGLLTIKGGTAFINEKEVGKIGFEIESVTYNAKAMCLQHKNGHVVYSYLGFRQKMAGDGLAKMCGDKLVVLKNGVATVFSDFERVASFEVPYGNFKVTEKFLVNYESSGFVIYDFTGQVVSKGFVAIKDIFVIGAKIVISNENIGMIGIEDAHKCTGKLVLENAVERTIQRGYVHNDALFFLCNNKIFYLLENGFLSLLICVKNEFLGIQNGSFYFYDKKLTTKEIDPIVGWQCQKNKKDVLAGREKECLGYLLKQKEYDLALKLFDSKFEIYLEMNKLNDAFKVAKNKTEYKILGNLFMKHSRYSRAADAFKLAEDAEMLFICDFLGKRKYMNDGKNDLFLKCLFLRDKPGLRKFLAGSEFEKAFEEFF